MVVRNYLLSWIRNTAILTTRPVWCLEHHNRNPRTLPSEKVTHNSFRFQTDLKQGGETTSATELQN